MILQIPVRSLFNLFSLLICLFLLPGLGGCGGDFHVDTLNDQPILTYRLASGSEVHRDDAGRVAIPMRVTDDDPPELIHVYVLCEDGEEVEATFEGEDRYEALCVAPEEDVEYAVTATATDGQAESSATLSLYIAPIPNIPPTARIVPGNFRAGACLVGIDKIEFAVNVEDPDSVLDTFSVECLLKGGSGEGSRQTATTVDGVATFRMPLAESGLLTLSCDTVDEAGYSAAAHATLEAYRRADLPDAELLEILPDTTVDFGEVVTITGTTYLAEGADLDLSDLHVSLRSNLSKEVARLSTHIDWIWTAELDTNTDIAPGIHQMSLWVVKEGCFEKEEIDQRFTLTVNY